jgi:hypothetical protein
MPATLAYPIRNLSFCRNSLIMSPTPEEGFIMRTALSEAARFLVLASAFMASALIAACGGGSGGSMPTTTGNVSGTPTTTSTSTAIAQATFSVSIPAPAVVTASDARLPQYISSNTNTIYISTVLDSNLPGQGCDGQCPTTLSNTVTLPVDATHCPANSDGSKSCTFTAMMPIGTSTFYYLGVNIANGDSKPLEFVQAPATIVPGGPNNISALLGPIIAVPTLVPVTQVLGNNQTIVTGLQFTYTDALSKGIPTNATGRFINPPQINDNDTSGQTSLSVTNGLQNSPYVDPFLTTDKITINYTPGSNPTDSFTITVTTGQLAFQLAPFDYLNYQGSVTPVPDSIPGTTSTYSVTCSISPIKNCMITTPLSFSPS